MEVSGLFQEDNDRLHAHIVAWFLHQHHTKNMPWSGWSQVIEHMRGQLGRAVGRRQYYLYFVTFSLDSYCVVGLITFCLLQEMLPKIFVTGSQFVNNYSNIIHHNLIKIIFAVLAYENQYNHYR